jgi:hypothetical protein
VVKSHTHSLALQVVSASPRAKIVREPGPLLWLAEALDVCPPSIVARRLGCSEDLVRGWRNGKSLPNLDQLARAPRDFTRRLLVSLGDHVRDLDQLASVDPAEALRLLYLEFGYLMAELSRTPLDRRTPEQLAEVEDQCVTLQEALERVRLAVRRQRTTVDAPQGEEGR